MCGRCSLYASPDVVARIFAVPPADADRILGGGPRYNIAPTTDVATVRKSQDGTERELVALRWGLIPHWAKDRKKGPLLINARAETITQKPSFRSSFKDRRCLVIADGFYEWQSSPNGKQPHYFRVDDGAPFAFAGIWDSWQSYAGELIESCAIITTKANQLTGLVHDRMPVILDRESWDTWLGQRQDDPTLADKLKSLLRPYPADRMFAFPVSTIVNSPGNNVPDCVEPMGPTLQIGSELI